MLEIIKNWFGKKEENEVEFPEHYAKIVFTKESQERGIFEDRQKEILRIRNGVVVQRKSFSIADLNAMKEIHKIPLWNATTKETKEYEFDELTALSGVIKEVINSE